MFLRILITSALLTSSFGLSATGKIIMNRIEERKAFHENTRTARTKFSPAEDQQLSNLVASYDDQENVNWSYVATIMKRPPRQCRERWKNYLNPSLNRAPWNEDEIASLIRLCTERGHNWRVIKQFFPNRSTNDIKNQWRRMSRKARKVLSTPLAIASVQLPDWVDDQDQLEGILNIFSNTEDTITGWHRYNSKEDQQLWDAIQGNCTYDRSGRRITDWDRVAEITGRSIQSCKSRYQHYLKPRLDK